MNRKLLDHLLKSGLTTSGIVQRALSTQRNRGGDLLEILVHQGVDDVDLARSLGSFHNLKVVDLTRVHPRSEALNRANGEFCRRYLVLPFGLERSSGDLLVAVADPSRAAKGLKTFQQNTGQRLRVYVAPRLALQEAVERAYGSAGEDFSTLGNPESSHISMVPGLDSNPGGRSGISGFDSSPGSAAGAGEMVSIRNFFDDSSPGEDLSASFFGRDQVSGVGAAKYRSQSDLHARERSAPPSSGSGPRSQPPPVPMNSADAEEIELLRAENADLRRALHRIEASLQLEINLLREMVEVLLDSGVIDKKTYLERMSKLR